MNPLRISMFLISGHVLIVEQSHARKIHQNIRNLNHSTLSQRNHDSFDCNSDNKQTDRNLRHHVATKFVGGFTSSPTSKSRLSNPLRTTNKGIDFSDRSSTATLKMAISSQQLSTYKRRVPDKDGYSLNKHHFSAPAAMRRKRNRVEDDKQNIVAYPAYISRHKRVPVVSSSSRLVPRGNNRLTLSSSIGINNMEKPSLRDWIRSAQNKVEARLSKVDIQDCAVYLSYTFTMAANTIPVILIPMIAADPNINGVPINFNGAALTGSILALSSLSAGIGKLINGFVCQSFGSRISGSVYLLGLSSFSLLLSRTSTMHAGAVAGMDFCSSIMWTACSVVLANKYEKNPKKFASAITILSLCSTVGTLLAKTIGSALLSKYHWRDVARVSTISSALGASLMFFVVKDKTNVSNAKRTVTWPIGKSSKPQNNESLNLKSILSSMSRVLSNKMFWLVALAHSSSYIARGSDKILGTFLRDTTQLPRHICGSLTSSLTIGFIWGLCSGRKIHTLPTVEDKKMFILKRQKTAFLSVISIAFLANKSIVALIGNNVAATAIAVASALMGASVSLQFYQFPAKFATIFGDDKAVCISLVDAIAFFLGSPIWATVGKVVGSNALGHGWSVAWMMLAGLFAIGGSITMKTIPVVVAPKN